VRGERRSRRRARWPAPGSSSPLRMPVPCWCGWAAVRPAVAIGAQSRCSPAPAMIGPGCRTAGCASPTSAPPRPTVHGRACQAPRKCDGQQSSARTSTGTISTLDRMPSRQSECRSARPHTKGQGNAMGTPGPRTPTETRHDHGLRSPTETTTGNRSMTGRVARVALASGPPNAVTCTNG